MTAAEFFMNFGPLIGAFFGAAAPITAVIIKFYVDKGRKQEAIRQAFKADLESTQPLIKAAIDTIQGSDDSVGDLDVEELAFIASPVTGDLLNQVGHLTSDESYKLVNYYRLLNGTLGSLRTLKGFWNPSAISNSEQEKVSEIAQGKVSELLDRNREVVKTLRKKLN